VATSPHDFKLMVAAAGKPKGEGQAQGPGYKPADPAHARPTPGVATVAEPAAPAAPPAQSAPAPSVAAPAPSAPPPSAPPPGF